MQSQAQILWNNTKPSSRVYFSVTTTQIKTENDSIFRNVPLLNQYFDHLGLALLLSLCKRNHVPRSPLRLASFASWDVSVIPQHRCLYPRSVLFHG